MTNELDNPWDYKQLNKEERKAYDEQLATQTRKVQIAQAVAAFIRDEEYYDAGDNPLKKVMKQLYIQKVNSGQIPPRPKEQVQPNATTDTANEG